MTEHLRVIAALTQTAVTKPVRSVSYPRFSNRSVRFDLKRRSDRTHASIRGPYGNRGCAAREVRDDDDCGSGCCCRV